MVNPMIDSDHEVVQALDLLAPTPPPDADGALRRQLDLQARSGAYGSTFVRRLAALARPLAALPVAAALVVALLVVTPVRGLAAQFLAVFRVQDVQPINIDNLNQPLPDLSQLGDMSPSAREMRLQPIQAASLSAASGQAGFGVRVPGQLPSGLPKQPTVMAVTNGASMNFPFRAQKARQYLDSTGHKDVKLPDRFDGATLHLQVFPAVSLGYLPGGTSLADVQRAASAEKAGGKPDASAVNALMNGNGLLIMESKSPELQVSGVSADELRDFLLSLPIPDSTKTQLRAIGDWKNTLPVPVAPGSNLHKVTVQGAPGVAGRNGAANMVLWVSNGMVYVAAGPKLDESALLAVASSMK